jgi:hypothetical protein
MGEFSSARACGSTGLTSSLLTGSDLLRTTAAVIIDLGMTGPNVNMPLGTLKAFLESTPPEVYEDVADAFGHESGGYGGRWVLNNPDLLLHCHTEECNGLRFYRCKENQVYVSEKGWHLGFLTYLCRNCQKTLKYYALSVNRHSDNSPGRVYKVGEIPVFGPPVPSRVITLIGPDRELFLLGRRSENHGLGIGAFAYYRRVVENQKGRIIGEIAKVAQKLGASAEVMRDFERAANETQFTSAIDDIKDGLPTVLMIDGHNPLTLMHKALSEGLHAKDDKTCLELSESIRVVLTELAERISTVLKDHQELKAAVSKLLNRKVAQAPPRNDSPEETK